MKPWCKYCECIAYVLQEFTANAVPNLCKHNAETWMSICRKTPAKGAITTMHERAHWQVLCEKMACVLRDHCTPVAGIHVERCKDISLPWHTCCTDQVNHLRKRTVADPAFRAKIINVLRMNSAALKYMCKFCLKKVSSKDNSKAKNISKLFWNSLYNHTICN